MVLETVLRYPLFTIFPVPLLQRWVDCGNEMCFAAGETIFLEGSAGTWMYLVLQGKVRILRKSASGREMSLGKVGPGELFGEYALLPPHRNTATCRSMEPTRLWRVSLLAFRAVLAANREIEARLKRWLRLHALSGYLRNQPFLGFLSAPSALAFLNYLEPVCIRAQNTIQTEGLSADRWFFIEKGQVALEAGDELVQSARTLGAGDTFGELALLGRRKLPTALALTETRCLVLPRDNFLPHEGTATSLQSLQPQHLSRSQSFPWVAQEEPADCGLAALSMICRFHGVEITVVQLRDRLLPGQCGVNLLALQQAGLQLGLRCRAVKVELEQLDQVILPVLAHLQNGHYVVVYEQGPDGLLVGDPATGIVRWGVEMFRQVCSGKLLLAHSS